MVKLTGITARNISSCLNYPKHEVLQNILAKSAGNLFTNYKNPEMEKKIKDNIKGLIKIKPDAISSYIHDNLLLPMIPVIDKSSYTGWTNSIRQPLLYFHNLLVETRWEHSKSDPPLGEIANLSKVSDKLYRGSQPTMEGFNWLVNNGIKTVVTFRDEDPLDLDLMKWKNVKHYIIKVKDREIPTFEEVKEFINIVNDPNNGKVYCHCRGGVGRTGIMVACWRVSQGWSSLDAINEGNTFAPRGELPENQKEFIRNFEKHYCS